MNGKVEWLIIIVIVFLTHRNSTNEWAVFICVTVVLVMINVVIKIIKQKRYINLLEEKCDPEAFLIETEKRLDSKFAKYYGKAYYLNAAVGHMLLGDYDKAFGLLERIDESSFRKSKYSHASLLLDKVICLNALGRNQEADCLYEGLYKYQITSPKLRISIDSLEARSLIQNGDLSSARRIYESILEGKLTTRQKAGITFELAMLDEKECNYTSAKERYEEIARIGNKLYCARIARGKLAKI